MSLNQNVLVLAAGPPSVLPCSSASVPLGLVLVDGTPRILGLGSSCVGPGACPLGSPRILGYVSSGVGPGYWPPKVPRPWFIECWSWLLATIGSSAVFPLVLVLVPAPLGSPRILGHGSPCVGFGWSSSSVLRRSSALVPLVLVLVAGHARLPAVPRPWFLV